MPPTGLSSSKVQPGVKAIRAQIDMIAAVTLCRNLTSFSERAVLWRSAVNCKAWAQGRDRAPMCGKDYRFKLTPDLLGLSTLLFPPKSWASSPGNIAANPD